MEGNDLDSVGRGNVPSLSSNKFHKKATWVGYFRSKMILNKVLFCWDICYGYTMDLISDNRVENGQISSTSFFLNRIK